MSDIKITMLGAPGAGKTCFLLGMYAIMREGVRGFTFSSVDPDQDLDVSDRWDKLVTETGATRWPIPNDLNVQNYRFSFNYGFNKLLGFDWIDYRGMAIADRASEADVQILKQHALSSESLLVCVSGEHLANGHGLTYARSKAQTARINHFLSGITESGRKPSVAIVVTKYDCCSGKDKQQVIDFVRELFNPLFAEGTGWFVMICPVSLGLDLATDRDAGTIDPKNVHLPVSFAIYSAFKQRISSMNEEIQRRGDLGREMGQSFFDRVFKRAEIRENLRAQEELRRQRERIERNIALLTEELVESTDIFYNGEEVDIAS